MWITKRILGFVAGAVITLAFALISIAGLTEQLAVASQTGEDQDELHAALSDLREGLEAKAELDLKQPPSDLFTVLEPRHRNVAKLLEIPSDQLALVGDLDRVIRRSLQSSCLSDVELVKTAEKTKATIESNRAISRRLAVNETRRKQAVSAAEKVVLLSILSERNAELLVRIQWRGRGPRALLDDELAARLKLSRKQREQLAEGISNSDKVAYEVQKRSIATPKMSPDAVRVDLEGRAIRKQAEDSLWEILTPRQIKEYKRMMEEIPKRYPD